MAAVHQLRSSNGSTNGSASGNGRYIHAPSRRASVARAKTRRPTGATTRAAAGEGAALHSFTPYATPRPDPSLPKPAILCDRCVALCCRYIALPLDTPESASDFDDIRWYLMHENVHVFVEDETWYIGIAVRCKNLAADNRCLVYETRPRICRGYDTDECEWHGTEYRYEHLFTSADQLEAFARQKLGRSILFRPGKKKPKLKRTRGGKRRIELPVA